MMTKMKLFSVSFIFSIIAIQVLHLSTIVNGQQAMDSCNSTLPLEDLALDSSLFQCVEVWRDQNYILRASLISISKFERVFGDLEATKAAVCATKAAYAKTVENTWSFILSTPDSLAYIAIGFSTNGRMIGSSAVVGWITSDGESGDAKQYLLGGMSPAGDVIPDQGDLKIVNGSLMIESVSSRLYMSFQLTAELPREKLLYAMGPADFFPSSPEFRLREHQFVTTTTINYNTGSSTRLYYSSGTSTHRVTNLNPNPGELYVSEPGLTRIGAYSTCYIWTNMSPSPAMTQAAQTPSSPAPSPSSAYGLSPSLLFFVISPVALKFY
ncbi:hypothetical protein F2Q70_00037622 [Brassica cretica]|uniref:DOMON domain-containing protein n=1 Tax=Brassica cretica TaxID=69181 RepID=A0A8S9JZ91_BRACR|nr:hypothetical protein F2Q70_00037622 [Brassica cretica]